MKDNFFIDSNIALYLLDLNGSRKKEIASALMKRTPFISPQVVFECLSVCTKKLKMPRSLAISFVTQLVKGSYLISESESVVSNALFIFDKYLLQPYDAKIIASATESESSILYSEDMQHGLSIKDKLTIVNPFL